MPNTITQTSQECSNTHHIYCLSTDTILVPQTDDGVLDVGPDVPKL